MFEYGWLAPAMFAGLIAFMLCGFPVAFSLGALGLSTALLAIELGYFQAGFLQALPARIFGVMSNDLLLAIPFFTFMGVVLERSRLAEDLLESTGQLFGPVPGGLAYAVIVVGAVLGAITGTVAASVIAMGLISLPMMMKYGYDTRLATGVIAASGTITQLIPPSLVLVVLADHMGVSVGDLYLGAIGPSVLQVLLFCLFIAAVSLISPAKVPALPPEARTLKGWPLVKLVLWGMIPSLGLIFLVLGTIFMGLATPTEAGAMGAVGALLLALVNRRLSWTVISEASLSTMRITAMVIFILIGASIFGLVFHGVDGSLWIKSILRELPGGQIGFLVFVNVFLFFVAFFLDFFEIAFIIVPLLMPMVQELGINPIWFGVLLCINLQTSFMHPPFGFALFYLRGIAPPSVKSSDIYWGAVPWILLQLALVVWVIVWPESVTYFLEAPKPVDQGAVQQKLEQLKIPGLDDLPPLGGPGGLDLPAPPGSAKP